MREEYWSSRAKLTKKEGRGRTEKGKNQPNISPPVLETDVQRGVVLIPNRDGAISTESVFGRVIQVPAKVLNKIVRPSRTCLAQRWVEHGKFLRVAGDFEAAGKTTWLGCLQKEGQRKKNVLQFSGEHRAGNSDPRVQLVQPYSQPMLNVGVGNDNTACHKQRNGNSRVEQHSDLRKQRPGGFVRPMDLVREERITYLDRRSKRANQLRKCDTKELREYDREQLESCSVESSGSRSEPDRVDHQSPVHDRAND